MNKYILISFLFISNILYGQNNILDFDSDNLKHVYPSSKFIFRKDSIFIKNPKKDIKDKKNILRSNLLEHISQNISVDVYSTNKYSVSEENNKFSDNFKSETTITSDIEISNIEIEEYRYNKKTKYLTGIIVVDKKKIAEVSLLKSIKDMESIILRLNNKNFEDINTIENIHKRCLVSFKLSLILDPESSYIKRFDTLNSEYYRLIFIIKNTNQEKKLKNDIIEIEKYIRYRDFVSAIELCEKSLKENPYNQSIIRLKEEIRTDFEFYTIQRSSYYLKENNKEQAIKLCNIFLSYFYDSEEVVSIKNKIELDIFNEISKEIKWNIEQNRIKHAQDKLNLLEKIKNINIDKFLELKALVLSHSKKEDFKEIKIMFNKKDYEKTYKRINDLEKSYGNDDFLIDMRKKTKHKLYIIDKKEFKKTQPELISIIPQIDMNSEYYDLNRLDNFNLERFYLSYSISINRKFEYDLDDTNTNGLFGIKFKYLDFKNFDTIGGGSNYQIGLNLVFPEYMFYEIGYHFNSTNPYYISAGLNIPLSDKLYTQIGIQSYTDFIKPMKVQGLISIQYRFDIIKKISKEDKIILKNKRI